MNLFWEHLSESALNTISPISFEKSNKIGRKKKTIFIRMLIAAVITAIISTCCYAFYEAWRLPAPKIIGEVPFMIEIPNEGTDTDFIQKAEGILNLLHIDTNGQQAVCKTEYATLYNRRQVKIYFGDIFLSFDEEDGALLSAELPKKAADGTAPISDDQALEIAKSLYEALPFPRGYRFSGANRICDEYCLYSFTRSYPLKINETTIQQNNPYEEIRITINMQSGLPERWNAFYFPLLEDSGATPISSDAAIALASRKVANNQQYTISAQLEIVLPNYLYSEYHEKIMRGESIAYPSVSRLAWRVRFTREISLGKESFSETIAVNVDYYTGAILGGDQTK